MKKKRSVFCIMLSIVLGITMCLGCTASVFAGMPDGAVMSAATVDEPAEGVDVDPVSDDIADLAADAPPMTAQAGSVLKAQNINKVTKNNMRMYSTGTVSGYTTYRYSIKMPKAGTLAIMYASSDSAGGYVSVVNKSSAGSVSYNNGAKSRNYYLKAGTYTLEVSVYSPESSSYNQVNFALLFAPSRTTTIKKGKVYTHGNKASNITYFKVKAPSKGFFKVVLQDGTGGGSSYSVQARTKGFSDYEYFSSNNNVRFIGVKKGTYTFKVKTYADFYDVKVTFKKVKESKYGSKKSKAKKMKKKSLKKGLMITKGQKTHWYKFKNPKTQKVKLVVKTKISDTGKYGGIKVTLYNRSGSSTSNTIYSGKGTSTIKYNTIGCGSKLKKGTYYIKVSNYNKGTGYFSLKWKTY